MANCTPPNRRAIIKPQSGVTLIELMTVVVVIAILGMIAIPSYRQYSMRAQRTEAKTALLMLATAQERFYLQNNTYSNNFAALNLTGMSENNVYTLVIPLANTQTYQANAVPTPGGGINGKDMNADVECAQFGINAQGLKTAAPDPNNVCW
jgi:type IV pilus assembly protein PilE